MTHAIGPGRLVGLLDTTRAPSGATHFLTRPAPTLTLDFEGIVADRHRGRLRAAGAREPWIPRGTLLRNDRQLTALCPDELAEIAAALGLAAVDPGWIGGNLVIAGLDAFSRIATGSRLAIGGAWAGQGRFDGAAILRVEGYNFPCRQSGRAIAAAVGRPEVEFGFVKAAARLRGLILSVDLAGTIAAGDTVVLIPPIRPRDP